MPSITLITAPDKLFNKKPSILLINPKLEIKDEFNKIIKEIDTEINLYMWESLDNETDQHINWLIEVANSVDHIVLDIDNTVKHYWTVGYLLTLPTCFYTFNGNEPMGFELINNNRIYTLDYLKNTIKQLEETR